MMPVYSVIQREDIYHHFQPIYSINDNSIYGFEALLRSDHFVNPEYAFEDAQKKGTLYELDELSIRKSISSFASSIYIKRNIKLFLNVFPSTILNPVFKFFITKMLDDFSIHHNQIILEISESEEIIDMGKLTAAVNDLKEVGVLIALDDIGKGVSELKSIIEIKPDFIKLDRYFTCRLSNFKEKQSVIHFLNMYCKSFNSQLVVEGIEDESDVSIYKDLGVKFAQGFALGKPGLLTRNIKINS